MPRQGDDFHRLVEHIERTFETSRNVTIESPKYLIDKVSGEKREHDIVLTYEQPHRLFRVAIECRDRSRPVGAPEIEAFHSKCQDTGIDKGIVVSSRGFAAPAMKKAEHYNIDCLLLEQVERMSRIVSMGFHFTGSHLGDCIFHLEVAEPYKEPVRLFAVTDEGTHKEIDIQNPSDFSSEIWNQLPKDVHFMEGGIASRDEGDVNFQFLNPEDYYIVDANGIRHNLNAFTLQIFYKNEKILLPYTFHEYKTGDDQLLYETATTDVFTMGGKSIRGIMTLRGNDLKVSLLTQEDVTSDQRSEAERRE